MNDKTHKNTVWLTSFWMELIKNLLEVVRKWIYENRNASKDKLYALLSDGQCICYRLYKKLHNPLNLLKYLIIELNREKLL